MFAATSDNHRLGLTAKHTHHVAEEMLDDNLHLLSDGGWMQRCIAGPTTASAQRTCGEKNAPPNTTVTTTAEIM